MTNIEKDRRSGLLFSFASGVPAAGVYIVGSAKSASATSRRIVATQRAVAGQYAGCCESETEKHLIDLLCVR